MENIFNVIKKGLENTGIIKPADNEKLSCPSCKYSKEKRIFAKNVMVCPRCGFHLRIGARLRIKLLTDRNSFHELFSNVKSRDFLNFPGYQEKLNQAKESTKELEAVICGTAEIEGVPCAVFAMDSRFIMASMGSVVGEKITRLFEYATKNNLPVVGFTASGGARMQEGIISLMQMAKVSGAVKMHSNKGNLYITVLTDPTTGGVTASFAMQGDIILSEPKALIGFAGRRVIEQTTKSKLPDNFQTAEFLLEHGFVDKIVDRTELKTILAQLINLNRKAEMA